jgi:chemotaxis protein CheC
MNERYKMKNLETINDFQQDVIREIGNIGVGNAATSLAHLLNDKISISVPKLHIIKISEIISILGGPEKEAVGVVVHMTNDVQGMLLYIQDEEFVKCILETILCEPFCGFHGISDMGYSVLNEISNILSGSYINAISDLTNLDIRLTEPKIAIDMIGAILNYPAAHFGEFGDKLLLIEEDFLSSGKEVKSHMLIIPDMNSLEIILKRLGAE